MRISKHFKGSSYDKSIQQKRDSLNQSYQKALSKFSDNGLNYSSKKQSINDSNYFDGMFLGTARPKKAYPVVPTYNDMSSKYSRNYSTKNLNPSTGTFTFNLKSPEKEANYQNYHRINNTSLAYQNSYYNDSPRKKPTHIFTGYESRFDYLSKKTQQGTTEKSFIQSGIYSSQRQPNNSVYNYSSPDKSRTTSQFSPTTSPSGKLHYLSLELTAQENKQKISQQHNKSSPTRSPTNKKEVSGLSSKNNAETNYLDKINSENNKETSQKLPSNSFQSIDPTSDTTASSKTRFPAPTIQPTLDKTKSVSKPSSDINKFLPTSAPTTSKLPTTSASCSPTLKENQEDTKLPAKPTSENTKSPTSKPQTQLSATSKFATTLPSKETTTKLPTVSSTPVSPQKKIINNENQHLSQINYEDIESLKNQTEFLDQVEKGMIEDTKENDLTQAHKMKKHDLQPSQSNDSTNRLSPNKSSPTKSSPTKSSPTRSSPTKSSPNKSSPNKSLTDSPNSFESPESFKSMKNNDNDNDYGTDLEIEIDFGDECPNYEKAEYDDDDEFIRLLPAPSKTVKVESSEFPKMLDILCTQDFFIKPKIKFMIESTIGLADKLTSDTLRNILIRK
ncbi:hypothetical protein M9Y10_009900 [Tritrichomonas musculus]|uniref:Uncharacterized protein n=1 Tax=Tritrichomonas musculus TaxID=1915356 RepID=A0ABR2IPT9_9EUKA